MQHPRTVVITGASSGIGAALAVAYAGPGMTLALTGRDRARLEEVSQRCQMAGARVETACLDICDSEAVAAWLIRVDQRWPVDVIIANAGISAGTGGSGLEDATQVRRILAINVDGVINTVLPLIPTMTARRRGQIALMSSLAGFRGLPGAPAYSASKAAVRVFGEGLRADLAAQGIGVSVICPGFIRTPMTDANPFPMPFLMEVDRAATLVRLGLARNQARIAFPWPTYALVWLLAFLPTAWTDGLLRLAPRKPGNDSKGQTPP